MLMSPTFIVALVGMESQWLAESQGLEQNRKAWKSKKTQTYWVFRYNTCTE